MILRRSSKSTCGAEEAVHSLPTRLENKLTPEQLKQIRYNDWRTMYEEGWPDASGERHRRPMATIAAMFRVSRQTVHDGIRVSREVQELIESIGADRY